jgi:glucose/arabinose dehydrogenase
VGAGRRAIPEARLNTRPYRFLFALACLIVCACDKTPSPPVVNPGPPQTINGTERLGWSQSASDAVELATFRYVVYVDSARFELSGASCARSGSTEDFTCTAPLPRMSAGAHTLELATLVVDGSPLESARSAPLQVTVVAATTNVNPAEAPSDQRSIADATIVTKDGLRLRLTEMMDGLVEPRDIAFAPDGRMFIAERGGQVRVTRDGRPVGDPAPLFTAGETGQQLIALAVDPSFDRSHFVYVIYSSLSASRAPAFTLARFREASNTFGNRVVLRDGILARAIDGSASLRFGADGKLFAAFDDGGIAERRADLASPNGKVLRLNGDGTTPDDQAGGVPMFADGYRAPQGFDWHPALRTLWVVDRDGADSGTVHVLATSDGPRKRGVPRAAFALPTGTVPSSAAFYRSARIPAMQNNLLIASAEGRHLLRVQVDRLDPPHIVSTERLLQDMIGPVRIVAVGPDGAIYVGTSSAIGKLTPVDR